MLVANWTSDKFVKYGVHVGYNYAESRLVFNEALSMPYGLGKINHTVMCLC